MTECLNPQTASGLFTLVACVVCLGIGAAGYRWLIRNKLAQVEAIEQAARDFDDKLKG